MSNIIREIFVEDHVQQVSTSIKETLRDLYLLLHARDFKFYISQAQWRVKIFAFFKKCFFIVTTLLHFFSFSLGNRVFRRFLKFFFLFGVIIDVSCISIFIRFFDLVCYAFQSSTTFICILSFISVFTISCSMWPSNFESRMQQM